MARDLSMENVRVGFKNFEGREGPYNRKGDRDFVVFIEDETYAKELSDAGWNVKYPKPSEHIDPSEDTRQPYLPVSVGFDYYPAKVYLVTDYDGKYNVTPLDEDSVEMLDWTETTNIDLIIRPYSYEVQGNKGIKAYLKAGYFTIETNEFDEKYGV